jgi:hypothetical protein
MDLAVFYLVDLRDAIPPPWKRGGGKICGRVVGDILANFRVSTLDTAELNASDMVFRLLKEYQHG